MRYAPRPGITVLRQSAWIPLLTPLLLTACVPAPAEPHPALVEAVDHSTGRMGYPRDEERAREIAAGVIRKVQRAAESGVLEAVFLMGTAYDEGLGKPVDPVLAASWHRRAAERGHVLGAHNLGNAYAEGRGGGVDPARAAEWWTRAAERGDAITQLRLGEAYEAGRGVPRDLDAAREWYAKAAAAGNAQAREALERLAAPARHEAGPGPDVSLPGD